eukprot:1321113-Pyramimonas_sp.AAC.1
MGPVGTGSLRWPNALWSELLPFLGSSRTGFHLGDLAARSPFPPQLLPCLGGCVLASRAACWTRWRPSLPLASRAVCCPAGRRQRPSGGLVCHARRSRWLRLGRRLVRGASMGLGRCIPLARLVRRNICVGDLPPSSCWGSSP